MGGGTGADNPATGFGMMDIPKGDKTHKQYEPKTKYFLKVTPGGDETIESLSFIVSQIVSQQKYKKLGFGEFNNYISSQYGTNPEYAIVEFFPNSRDVHLFPEGYETCEQALNYAIRHLNRKGLDATPFDLEALINKTSIRSIFYK